ncbi:DedA family protein [Streptomyces radicis]|uniref:VTT domain-containing protein n=1 Tax=Streptomyces radicis TaxID=1750517 RepID=A0A3A9WTK5_9ACTN|nr:VTT domain-containing protein [Streptomyces radicis]RKN12874.1 hypothetical protein D7319_02795 [Streptomyces radicis]RKN27361.1 hypothetical protein D7318_00100 [Streptomyces radicis]
MDTGHALETVAQAQHLAYLVLFTATATPFAPNAALVMGAGALAAHGHLSLLLVGLSVLAGTLVGDLVVYAVGRRLRRGGPGPPVPAHPGDGRVRARLAWLRRMTERAAAGLHRRGGAILVPLRFVPGGRATGSAAAGLSGYPISRYAAAAMVAELAWTGIYVGAGYGGGSAVAGPVPALAAAGIALATALLLRWHRARRGPATERGFAVVGAHSLLSTRLGEKADAMPTR